MTTAIKILYYFVVLGDVQCGVMHLPLVWAKYYPSLLNKEVVMSSIYGESWTICVKENDLEKIVFYGQGMKRFIKRFQLTHAFKVDFQKISRLEFMVRICDNNGVEIDFSPTWLDSRTENIGIENKTSPTLCTIFWDEHVVKGELSRINGGDDTICLYGDDFKKFTDQYKIKYGSRIILQFLNVINVFVVKILDIDGVEIDYGISSSIEHNTCLSALESSAVRNAKDEKFVEVSERICEDPCTEEVHYTNNSSIEQSTCSTAFQVPDGRNANDDIFVVVAETNFTEHIPRKIVREYLHPIGSPTYANMCFGEEKRIECIIKWGDNYYGVEAYITRPMKKIIKEIKLVPGSNVLFNIIGRDLMRKSVTFEVVNIGEIILSLTNDESARVKVKRDSSGQVVLYGDSFEQFIDRYHLHQDYRMNFQNNGAKQFLVRIRDTQGVEREYELRMIDNSRWFQSKKK
ncbi:hypothetical protein ACFE04_023734 [Oxalis oulophora]